MPAVQALGQCIFLPMLIIGGIAVPLASLPDWAQHLSAFFPGRYAVDALQACVNGAGLRTVRFNLLALGIIGAGGAVAAAKMFRWDAQQRFARRSGKAWVMLALAAWAIVGGMAEYRGRIVTTRPASSTPSSSAAPTAAAPAPSAAPGVQASAPSPRVNTAEPKLSPQELRTQPPRAKEAAPAPRPPDNTAGQRSSAAVAPPRPARSSWQEVTIEDIDRDLVFDHLPSDNGIVTPIAAADEEPDPDAGDHYQYIREMLPSWQPGKVPDPVQRVRNILYVAAVPDVLQAPIERFAPLAVYERLQEDVPKDQLVKILYWIALHPTDGDETAVDQLWALRFSTSAVDMQQVRERAAIYAVKLLGRLLGKLPG